MSHSGLIQSLAAIVGNDELLTGEPAVPFCTDWRGRYSGDALAVVFPANTRQVAEVVKLCAASRIAIVPQGGNTSLCGASVPLPAWCAACREPVAHEPRSRHQTPPITA